MPYNAGFTWQDISNPSVCTSATIGDITIQVTVGFNCGYNNEAVSGDLTGHNLAQILNLGAYHRQCPGAAGVLQIVTIFASKLCCSGSNTLTFHSPFNFGVNADAAGTYYAKITVFLD